MDIDPDRECSLCQGPILRSSVSGVCRTSPKCRRQDDEIRSRPRKPKARRAKKKNQYRPTTLLPPAYELKPAPEDASEDYFLRTPATDEYLLDENGSRVEIVDEVAIHIAVHGIRKVAMTHRERVEATRRMLLRGMSIREMCDNLHVQSAVVRDILDELGFECVRNEHIAGSKIMVILPKNRIKNRKIPRLPR